MNPVFDLFELDDDEEIIRRINALAGTRDSLGLPTEDYKSGIHLAIERGSVPIAKALLAAGARYFHTTRYGQSGLGYAAMYGTPAIFDLLLQQALQDKKVDLVKNQWTFSNITHYSANEGIFDHMVEEVLDYYAPRDYECTGLQIANRVRNVDTLMCLYPEAVRPLQIECMEAPVPGMVELVQQHLQCSILRRVWIKAVVLSLLRVF